MTMSAFLFGHSSISLCIQSKLFDLYSFSFDLTYDKTQMEMTKVYTNTTNKKLVYVGFILMKEIN